MYVYNATWIDISELRRLQNGGRQLTKPKLTSELLGKEADELGGYQVTEWGEHADMESLQPLGELIYAVDLWPKMILNVFLGAKVRYLIHQLTVRICWVLIGVLFHACLDRRHHRELGNLFLVGKPFQGAQYTDWEEVWTEEDHTETIS